MSIFGHTTTRNRVKYNTGSDEPEEMILNEDHVATGFANFWRKLTGSHLTTAEIEANQFSAQQAELAFEREAEFYEKYQSIGAQVQQMRDAGINPFGAAGVSSGNGVRSASPSSVSPSSGSLGFNPLDFVLGIFNMRNQKRLIDAEVNLKNAEANRINQETPYAIQKLMSEIAELDERAQLHVGNLEKVLNDSKVAVKSLELTDKQIEHFDSIISKLSAEVKTIDGIRDSEKRIKDAQAAISEFESSIANLVSDFSNDKKVTLNDFAGAVVKILMTKFVGK